ncbi:hypothetical protein L227DRAFT_337796 [Lentinus tigrinus ALCF2SS1-6]|uniref:Uncharacterized protein n=1 Tax=Lentinus tigrinus ALCF2SS1-6 TaxID=1328759 RepID=A0A5C2RVP1_9APHY|nr:hypothetical protein L227DRAFT_337796 [Lentinus tigrinus ALCF2SS1-6]
MGPCRRYHDKQVNIEHMFVACSDMPYDSEPFFFSVVTSICMFRWCVCQTAYVSLTEDELTYGNNDASTWNQGGYVLPSGRLLLTLFVRSEVLGAVWCIEFPSAARTPIHTGKQPRKLNVTCQMINLADSHESSVRGSALHPAPFGMRFRTRAANQPETSA